MKIAILGHSFAADHEGWPSMLNVAEENNFSQKGISEAKIYMQWLKIKDQNWDKIVVCHSNPTTIYTPFHPVHYMKKSRANTDWIIEDIEHHRKTNSDIQLVHDYLSKYNDTNYNQLIFDLFLEKLLEIPNSIHITMGEDMHKGASIEWIAKIPNNFHKIWIMNQGTTNHMDEEGNKQIATEIKKLL